MGRWPLHSEILNDVLKRAGQGRWRALDDSWIEFPKGYPELIRYNPNSGMGIKESAELRRWQRPESLSMGHAPIPES